MGRPLDGSHLRSWVLARSHLPYGSGTTETTLFAEPILAAGRSSPCDVTSAYVKGSLRLKKADKIIYHLRCYPELISRQTDGKCLRQMQLSG